MFPTEAMVVVDCGFEVVVIVHFADDYYSGFGFNI